MSMSMSFGKHVDNELSYYDQNNTPYLVNGVPVTRHTPDFLILNDPLSPDDEIVVNLNVAQSIKITVF